MFSGAQAALQTIEEIAGQLRLQPETIRQMAREGRLPAHKVGRVWRFDPVEIEQWLSRQGTLRNSPSDRVHELVLPLYDIESSGERVTFTDPAFTENRTEAIHRWVPWIAGFSAGFVADCLREYLDNVPSEAATVFDPFAGVGTTLLEAYRRGFNAIGFEINPYAALAARAKLEAGEASLPLLEFWLRIFELSMRDANPAQAPAPIAVPPGFRSRIPFFSKQIECQVLNVLAFIRGLADPKLRDLFLVAFGSVMVKFSNYTYEPSLTTRPGSGKPLVETADVACIVANKLADMAQDCRSLQTEICGLRPTLERKVIQDSVFNASQYLADSSIDLIVTSPPYLNNYHYIRNTRPHLFWLEMVEDTTGLRHIEEASFGKFWQTVRDGDRLHLNFDMPELEAIVERLRKTNTHKGIYGGEGWANYVVQYFNDTDRLCALMLRLLKPGSHFVVVIGNSILQGIEVKVDEFLARIAERHGFKRVAIHMLRNKRVGNSIIRSSVRNAAEQTASLYEVAVVLQKI